MMEEDPMKKLSPKVAALLSFPGLLIVSLPFSFIAGALAIIATDNIALGWGVGITVATLFALWASYGMYKLSSEVRAEDGAKDVRLSF